MDFPRLLAITKQTFTPIQSVRRGFSQIEYQAIKMANAANVNHIMRNKVVPNRLYAIAELIAENSISQKYISNTSAKTIAILVAHQSVHK